MRAYAAPMRWNTRGMLPGRAAARSRGAKRTARDWIVDATMLLCSAIVGAIAFVVTTQRGLAPDGRVPRPRVRRARASSRCGGGAGGRSRSRCSRWIPSMFSAFAAGAALIALFNVALRGTAARDRASARPLSVAAGLVYSLSIPIRTADVLGRRAALVPDPGGRDPVGPVRPRAARPAAQLPRARAAARGRAAGARRAGAARPSGGGSRARCTTCSPTGSRCCQRARGRAGVPPGRAAGGDRRGRGRDPRDRPRRAAGAARGDRRAARGRRRRRPAAADAGRDPGADRGVARGGDEGARAACDVDGRATCCSAAPRTASSRRA